MTATTLRWERHQLADLYTRMEDFCLDRGWDLSLIVHIDRDGFGRVGAVVEQPGGDSFRAFGNTTNDALRNLALTLERDGFDA